MRVGQATGGNAPWETKIGATQLADGSTESTAVPADQSACKPTCSSLPSPASVSR